MSWTPEEIEAVWNKGSVVPNNDSSLWRKDECSALIHRASYGARDSQYGWEIDHIISKEQGGTNKIANLRPLQWQNKASKTEGKLKCAVITTGTQNVAVKW